MRQITSRAIAAAVAGALTLTALPVSAAQAASPKATAVQVTKAADTSTDFSARRRYYRGGNPAAAIAAFGLIAGAIAASQRPDYGYYGYGYGPPRPYYGGYGYGPRYYNPGYRYW